MPRQIEWDDHMIEILQTMREDGCWCEEIAQVLGISKNAVVNQCSRLHMPVGNRFRGQRLAAQPSPLAEDRDDDPLPPGHDLTWGAIARGAAWTGQVSA